jgi:hypothetical protein
MCISELIPGIDTSNSNFWPSHSLLRLLSQIEPSEALVDLVRAINFDFVEHWRWNHSELVDGILVWLEASFLALPVYKSDGSSEDSTPARGLGPDMAGL